MPKKIERKIDSESLRPQGVRLPLDTFASELRRVFGSRSSSSEVARPGVHAGRTGIADAATRPTDPDARHPAHGLHLVHPAHGLHAAHAACLSRVLRAVQTTRRTHGAEERK